VLQNAAYRLLQLAAKVLQLAKQIWLLPWLLRIFIVVIAHSIPSLILTIQTQHTLYAVVFCSWYDAAMPGEVAPSGLTTLI
jgi:hypothetical protein